MLAVLGASWSPVALVRIIALARQRRGDDDAAPGLSPAAVLRLAGRELADVQREREARDGPNRSSAARWPPRASRPPPRSAVQRASA